MVNQTPQFKPVGFHLLLWCIFSHCIHRTESINIDLLTSYMDISGNNQAADGQQALTVTVVAQTSQGQPIESLSVALAAGRCLVEQPTALTDEHGKATGTIRSTQIGQYTVSATLYEQRFRWELPQTLGIKFYPVIGEGQLPAGEWLNFQLSPHQTALHAQSGAYYLGTIAFTSSDPLATLPEPYTFTEQDQGGKLWLDGIMFRTIGEHIVTVRDTTTQDILVTLSFSVTYGSTANIALQTSTEQLAVGDPVNLSIAMVDMAGNINKDYQGQLTISSSNPQDVLISQVEFNASHQGQQMLAQVARFSTIGSHFIQVQDANYNSSLLWLTIVPGQLHQLVLTELAPKEAGVWQTVRVQAQDKANYPIRPSHFWLTWRSSDTNAILPETHLFIPDQYGFMELPQAVRMSTAGLHTLQVSIDGYPEVLPGEIEWLIEPGDANHLLIRHPSTAVAGDPLEIWVEVHDRYDNATGKYVGSLILQSSDPTLINNPSIYPLQPYQAGRLLIVPPLQLQTAGQQTLLAMTTMNDLPAVTGNILIQPGPTTRLDWINIPQDVTAEIPWQANLISKDSYGNPTPLQAELMISSTDANAMFPSLIEMIQGQANLVIRFSNFGSWRMYATASNDHTLLGTTPSITSHRIQALAVAQMMTDGSACALLDGGQIKCWGSNLLEQLGLGDTTPRGMLPSQMATQLPYVNLGTSRARTIINSGVTTCALLEQDSVGCWGDRNDQLIAGFGLAANVMGSGMPLVHFGTERNILHMGGSRHLCVILSTMSNPEMKCWGLNHFGQLGLGDTITRSSIQGNMYPNLPIVSLGTNRFVMAMTGHLTQSCVVLDNGTAKCWGQNNAGQLGQGDTITRGDNTNEMGDFLPALSLGTGRTVEHIAPGSLFTCALLQPLGEVKCWGLATRIGLQESVNHRGDALGEMADALPIVQLGTHRTALSISIGPDSMCAVLDNQQIKCFGENNEGQLGLEMINRLGDNVGEMGDNLPFVNLGSQRWVEAVAVGSLQACALLDDHTLKCWGRNHHGQLGLGTVNPHGRIPGTMGNHLPLVHLW